MVKDQIESRGIRNQAVLAAMRSVPRHLFVPSAFSAHAYDDTPLPIGHGQTISQPYMVALMTSLLEIVKGVRVLEIGAGSGYQAAILAAMGCTVIGIERITEIYKSARLRLQKMGLRSIYLHKSDGTMGYPQASPYERILVSAGAPNVPPPLIGQLAEEGIMLIPVGTRQGTQRLVRVRKSRGRIFSEDLGPAMFVDLVGNHGW